MNILVVYSSILKYVFKLKNALLSKAILKKSTRDICSHINDNNPFYISKNDRYGSRKCD